MNYQVAEEDVSLVPGQGPGLVDLEVYFGRWDQPEDLLAAEDVIPDGRTSEVDVEIWRQKNKSARQLKD